MLLKCGISSQDGGSRPFQFHAFWKNHLDYPSLVHNALQVVNGSMPDRLNKVKEEFLIFNKEVCLGKSATSKAVSKQFSENCF